MEIFSCLCCCSCCDLCDAVPPLNPTKSISERIHVFATGYTLFRVRSVSGTQTQEFQGTEHVQVVDLRFWFTSSSSRHVCDV